MEHLASPGTPAHTRSAKCNNVAQQTEAFVVIGVGGQAQWLAWVARRNGCAPSNAMASAITGCLRGAAEEDCCK